MNIDISAGKNKQNHTVNIVDVFRHVERRALHSSQLMSHELFLQIALIGQQSLGSIFMLSQKTDTGRFQHAGIH